MVTQLSTVYFVTNPCHIPKLSHINWYVSIGETSFCLLYFTVLKCLMSDHIANSNIVFSNCIFRLIQFLYIEMWESRL